jgi:hypothetical protein
LLLKVVLKLKVDFLCLPVVFLFLLVDLQGLEIFEGFCEGLGFLLKVLKVFLKEACFG